MNDILIDDELDMKMERGDLVTGLADLQHQHLLLISNKGDWKESPTVGVGVHSWLKDDEPAGLLAEIKKEFERDGMTVNKVEILTDGKLNVDANY
jgi:hypothetical protein